MPGPHGRQPCTLGCTRPRANRPKRPVGEGLPVVVGGEHRGQLHAALFHRFYNLQSNVRQDGGPGHTPSTGRMRCRVGGRTQDWLGGAAPCRDPAGLPLLRSLLTQLAVQGQPRPLQAPPAEVTAPGASWLRATLQTEAHCSPCPSHRWPPSLTGLRPDGRVAGHQWFCRSQMGEFLFSFGQATRALPLLAPAGDEVLLGPCLPPSGAAPGPQWRPPWSRHQ